MSSEQPAGGGSDSEQAGTCDEQDGGGGEPSGAAGAVDGEASPSSGEVAGGVWDALRTVIDPELGINIVDLGLVYDVGVEEGSASVTMTLTSPGCPAGGQILGGAKTAAESADGVDEAVVSLVWKPFWTPDKIDPKVRAMLGV